MDFIRALFPSGPSAIPPEEEAKTEHPPAAGRFGPVTITEDSTPQARISINPESLKEQGTGDLSNMKPVASSATSTLSNLPPLTNLKDLRMLAKNKSIPPDQDLSGHLIVEERGRNNTKRTITGASAITILLGREFERRPWRQYFPTEEFRRPIIRESLQKIFDRIDAFPHLPPLKGYLISTPEAIITTVQKKANFSYQLHSRILQAEQRAISTYNNHYSKNKSVHAALSACIAGNEHRTISLAEAS